MQIIKKSYFHLLLLISLIVYTVAICGCANIIPPGGGPKDTLPPILISAIPKDSTIHFKGDKITLSFNEFVELQSPSENVIFSPTPTTLPIINAHLRNVTLKIKDTLEPNTTYSINFGNSIKDVNEGNVYKDFMYVFSTGNSIDNNTITGKVIMAETGKIDSTLLVVLHKNNDDSAVVKERPRYIAKVDGNGNFLFSHLPKASFSMYAIPANYSKHYEDTTKPFAFTNGPISTTSTEPITLLAYQLKKIDTATAKKRSNDENKDKKLRITTNLEQNRLDLLENPVLTFNRKIATFDSSKIKLFNKDLKPLVNYKLVLDSTNKNITILYNWTPGTSFNLAIDSTALYDTSGIHFSRNDTLRFTTKSEEEYGSVLLRFSNLDFGKNPVLQIVQNENIVESILLTNKELRRKLFSPGEYDLRILYDANKNGIWDPGQFFGKHIQPEQVVLLNTKLSVRANWDNEKDIILR